MRVGIDEVDVLLVSLCFYPVYSGPGVRFRRYAPGLRRRGIDLQVFSGTHPGIESLPGTRLRVGERIPTIEVDTLPIHRVALPGRRGLLQHAAFTRALAQHCRSDATGPGVIQFLDFPQASLLWLSELRLHASSLVFTSTMALPDFSANRFKRWVQRRFWPVRHQAMDCLVVSSGVMADAFRGIGVETRIEVIPNGVDLQRFRPADSAERGRLRGELGLPEDGEIILFIGSISPRKGIDRLVRAWDRIAARRPNAYLVLVGPDREDIRPWEDGPGYGAQTRASLTGASGLERVAFTGLVDSVERYLQTADVLVLPSRREGMPNVVPEAFACGLPCVLTPFIGLPAEFGTPGEHYVLAPGDWPALADAIVDLLENPDERVRMREASLQLVRDRMDVERSLDLYAGLYEDLDRGSA